MAESLPVVEESVKDEISKILKSISQKVFDQYLKFVNAEKAVMKTVGPYIKKAACYVVNYIRQLGVLQNAKELLEALSLGKVFQAISKLLTKAEKKLEVVEKRIETLDMILKGPIEEKRPLTDQENKSFDALTIQLDASLQICQGYLDQIKEKMLKVQEKVQVVSAASTVGKCFSFAVVAMTGGYAYAKYDKLTTMWKIGLGANAVGFALLGLATHVVGKAIEERLSASAIQENHADLQKDLDALQKEYLAHKRAKEKLSY